jgi:hypothetical protein
MEIKRGMRVRLKEYQLVKVDGADKRTVTAPGSGHVGRVDDVLTLRGMEKPVVRVRFDDRDIVDAYVLGELLEVIE